VVSILFGPIRQVAFVVEDIDAAMTHWAGVLGVGPFHVKRRIRFEPFIYQGEPRPSPEVSIALANSGDLQVELTEQHCERPSIYRDFLQGGGPGLQHVAAWTNRPGFERLRASLIERGYGILQECAIPASGVRLCYLATNDAGAPVFEIADLLDESHLPRIDGIRDDAARWDGTGGIIEVDR
jgi:hypothetical protein